MVDGCDWKTGNVTGISSLKPEMYICSFLSAITNTNTNAFVKNKEIQIRVKILPKNVFENTKTNTFQILLIYLWNF